MALMHFAGINTRPLAQAAKGQDVLMSYADVKKSAGFWRWMRPLIEAGHFRSVILDSGAFTELSQRKLGKSFSVGIEEFAAFAAEFQHLFAWVANLDSIEGDVERSNRNLQALVDAGVQNVVPVYHEGESLEQLAHCIEMARAGLGMVAVGCQRPKGSLVPRNVVAFLRGMFAQLDDAGVDDVAFHGFGLTRYASADTCPCGGEGFPFSSTDSTTWNAEACAVERSGAMGRGIEARHRAFAATMFSYQAVRFAAGRLPAELPSWAGAFDDAVAVAAGSQAKTVALRLRRLAA